MARERIIDLQKRGARVGTIRAGETDERGNPTGRDTFLLTSPSREILEQLAAVYDNPVVDWPNDRSGDAYAVETGRAELRIMLPPFQPIEQQYEQWGGGGLLRRCDGTTVEVTDPDTGEVTTQPCLCSDEEPTCKITTRLSVVLTDVFSIGKWLFTTGSEYAARELPWAVDTLQGLHAASGGLIRAVLRLEAREVKRQGEKFRRKFHVVTLDVDPLIAALDAGTVQQQLPAPPSPDRVDEDDPEVLPSEPDEPKKGLTRTQLATLFGKASEIGVDRERVREIAKETLGHGVSEMDYETEGKKLWEAIEAESRDASD